ncbi:type I methionyl aminopeptidase [Candidatus Parcubacteria bacterium]|nr:type I methionyl aminopeptidase [Candidatus Parcubacteria bacterium]
MSKINIYTEKEIETLKEGGKILYTILHTLKDDALENVSTKDLDMKARELCLGNNAIPAFLNYTPGGAPRPFPGSICISVNHEVVHGIPNEKARILKKGDVVTLDMGIKYKDMFTDSAITLVVGGAEYNKVGQEMIDVANRALYNAIDMLKPGVRTGDIGQVVEDAVKNNKGKKFKIPTILGGHGIGHGIHEDPFIPNFGKSGEGVILKEGNVIAIEPILTENSTAMNQLSDGYTFVTQDKGLAVHVEHTVVITSGGAEIITQ